MKQPPTDPAEDGRPRPKRPSGHGSYRLSDEPVPGPVPGGHAGDRPTHYWAAMKYDDGVVHTPHYDADGHDDLHNDDVAHEHSDVNIRAVIASAVILAIVGIVSQVAMAFLFGWFETQAAQSDPQVPAVAAPRADMPQTLRDTPYFSTGVGGPRLLTNEPQVLREQRAKEAAQLHGYGWVNQAGGVAHIPIDEAKKLILERGLPVRQGEPVPSTLGTRLPAAGEASSGRVITGSLPERPADAPAEPQKPPAPQPRNPGGH